jgi:NADH:ubiquinone oxidoreductase subunit B-like Fe-S oxidoreductase
MARTTDMLAATAERHAQYGMEFSLLVAALFPGCLAVELMRPSTTAQHPRVGTLAGALDRARGTAALAFSLPG